jgi:hypothetical protein
MIWIIKAAPKNDYRITVAFNDGLQGVIDFKPILEQDTRKVVRELLDVEKFKKMTMDMDTLCWENGVDFAPEFLYHQLLLVKKNKPQGSKKRTKIITQNIN